MFGGHILGARFNKTPFGNPSDWIARMSMIAPGGYTLGTGSKIGTVAGGSIKELISNGDFVLSGDDFETTTGISGFLGVTNTGTNLVTPAAEINRGVNMQPTTKILMVTVFQNRISTNRLDEILCFTGKTAPIIGAPSDNSMIMQNVNITPRTRIRPVNLGPGAGPANQIDYTTNNQPCISISRWNETSGQVSHYFASMTRTGLPLSSPGALTNYDFVGWNLGADAGVATGSIIHDICWLSPTGTWPTNTEIINALQAQYSTTFV